MDRDTQEKLIEKKAKEIGALLNIEFLLFLKIPNNYRFFFRPKPMIEHSWGETKLQFFKTK